MTRVLLLFLLLCALWLYDCIESSLSEDRSGCKYFDSDVLRSTIHEAVGVANGREQKLLILPIFFFGLANRLRMISSMVPIAEKINKHILVLWFPSHECNSTFDALFTSTHHNITFMSLPSGGNSLAEILEVKSNLTAFITTFQAETGAFIIAAEPRAFFLDPEEAYYTADILLFWPITSVTTTSTTCEEYYSHRKRLYSQLQPSQAVSELISSYDDAFSNINDNNNNKGTIIGVHIRAYDGIYDWNIVTPPLASRPGSNGTRDTTLYGFDVTSPLEAFLHYLREIKKERAAARRSNYNNNDNDNDDTATRGPHLTRVFLATNSPDLKHELHNMVNALSADKGEDFILTIQSDLSNKRGDPAGLVLAAAELVLLSRCSLILHSKGSSFAQEAALMGGVALVDIAASVAPGDAGVTRFALGTYGYDPALPYCGLAEYVQHDESDYREDKRSRKSSGSGNDDDVAQAATAASISVYGESLRNSNGDATATPAAIADSSDGREVVCFEQPDRVMCTRSAWLCPCSAQGEGGAVRIHESLARAEALGVHGLLCWSRGGAEEAGCVRSVADSNGASVLPGGAVGRQ